MQGRRGTTRPLRRALTGPTRPPKNDTKKRTQRSRRIARRVGARARAHASASDAYPRRPYGPGTASERGPEPPSLSVTAAGSARRVQRGPVRESRGRVRISATSSRATPAPRPRYGRKTFRGGSLVFDTRTRIGPNARQSAKNAGGFSREWGTHGERSGFPGFPFGGYPLYKTRAREKGATPVRM